MTSDNLLKLRHRHRRTRLLPSYAGARYRSGPWRLLALLRRRRRPLPVRDPQLVNHRRQQLLPQAPVEVVAGKMPMQRRRAVDSPVTDKRGKGTPVQPFRNVVESPARNDKVMFDGLPVLL